MHHLCAVRCNNSGVLEGRILSDLAETTAIGSDAVNILLRLATLYSGKQCVAHRVAINITLDRERDPSPVRRERYMVVVS